MFSTSQVEIVNAVATRKPVYCRQIGGVTWLALQLPKVDFSIFEYWIGDDYPGHPESVTKTMDELLRARIAVRRFLIAQGRQLGDWYEYLAHEVGLDIDADGIICEPKSGDTKHRGEFKPKGIKAP